MILQVVVTCTIPAFRPLQRSHLLALNLNKLFLLWLPDLHYQSCKQMQTCCSSLNSLFVFVCLCFPYAPCMEYLPTFTINVWLKKNVCTLSLETHTHTHQWFHGWIFATLKEFVYVQFTIDGQTNPSKPVDNVQYFTNNINKNSVSNCVSTKSQLVSWTLCINSLAYLPKIRLEYRLLNHHCPFKTFLVCPFYAIRMKLPASIRLTFHIVQWHHKNPPCTCKCQTSLIYNIPLKKW